MNLLENAYRTCGVVVLYNPNEEILLHISDYQDAFNLLLIIDNSDYTNDKRIKNFVIEQKFHYRYLWLGENKGLSFAYNYACKYAEDNNYDFIMILDQDSYISKADISQLFEYLAYEKMAIVTPEIISYFNNKPVIEDTSLNFRLYELNPQRIQFAISSGTCFSIGCYETIGKFDELLFIEHVDTDFCIRANLNNIKIIRLYGTKLFQRAGNSVKKRFLWKFVHPLFQSPIRVFYLYRNQIYLFKKYGFKIFKYCKPLIFSFIKMLFYEDHKFLRCKYLLLGIIFGCIGRMGKYNGAF